MKHSLLALATTLLTTGASAQTPDFPDFSSMAGLSLVERAAQNGNQLRVHDEAAPTGGGNLGAVWFTTPVAVVNGFETEFTFNINQGGGLSTGGDGMAFVIQNEQVAGFNGGVGVTGVGRHASAMGYGWFVGSPVGETIDNALVVELDTFNNGSAPAADPIDDPDGNHISVHTGGNADCPQQERFSIGRADNLTLGANLNDGQDHTVRVVYVPGTLEVWFDGAMVIQTPYSFGTGGTHIDTGLAVGGLDLIGGTSAYVGFTAGSGGSVENHDLVSWTWNGGGVGVPYCTAAANSSGAAAAISGTGSQVAAVDDLTLMVGGLPPQQFGIFVASRTQGFVPGAGGTSNGTLCLSGSIGRFRQPNQILSSGAGGTFSLRVPLTQIPQGAATVGALAGDTWNFQAWFRDGVGLGSNFSNGLEVLFL